MLAPVKVSVYRHTHAHTHRVINIIEIARQTGITQEQCSHHQWVGWQTWLRAGLGLCPLPGTLWAQVFNYTMTTDIFSWSYSLSIRSLRSSPSFFPFTEVFAHNLKFASLLSLFVYFTVLSSGHHVILYKFLSWMTHSCHCTGHVRPWEEAIRELVITPFVTLVCISTWLAL